MRVASWQRVVTTSVPLAGMKIAIVAGREPWTNRYRYEPPHGSVLGFNSGGLIFRRTSVRHFLPMSAIT